MLFSNKFTTKNCPVDKKYCYCKYGESGIMINCDKCSEWFHDECLGLSESEISNIEQFFCNECLNINSELHVVYRKPLKITAHQNDLLYCYCRESEYGHMVECGKCRDWFHSDCTELSEHEIKLVYIFFCVNCLHKHNNLNIMFKDEVDHTKEHTKPLFCSNRILSIYNLYPYHMLLELYKILKFRVPYCMYDSIANISLNNLKHGLTISIPETNLDLQRKTFHYQSILCWNKLYKKLLTPFTVILHKSCQIKGDNTIVKTTNYDFSTPISTFKLNLKKILFETQHNGTEHDWKRTNTLLHNY